jgi:hypothetical protein
MSALNEQAVEAALQMFQRTLHPERVPDKHAVEWAFRTYFQSLAEQGERMVSVREVFPYLSHRPGCTAIIGQGPDKTDPLIPGSCTCGLRDFAPTEADR